MVRLAWITAMCAAALLVLSCGRGPQSVEDHRTPDGRIVVDFWHAMSGGHARSINEMVDAYNASQDKYLVRGIYQGHYAALQQKLIASLYAGQPPAMSLVYESWANQFLTFGNLQPVAHFLEKDAEWAANDLPDIFQTLRDNNSYPIRKDEAGEWILDEAAPQQLATLPFNKSVYMLFINQTLMNEVGYAQPPRTWAEMEDLSQKMTVREDGVIQRYGFATRRTMESITPFIFAAGINYTDEQNNFQMTTPEAEAAIEFLTDLVLGEDSSGYVEPGYLSSGFGQGRIGMWVGSTASFPFNDGAVGNKFIWSAHALPAMDEDTRPMMLSQGTNIGIFKQGFNGMGALPEEVQDGAWDFLKYLMRPEVSAKWAKDSGYIPVRESALELPEVKEFLEANPNYASAYDLIPQLAFEPRPIWWNDIRDLLMREVEAVLLEKKTPGEMLQSVQDRATAIKLAGA
jgi:multiple sugar transport system substrate-binding protein